MDNKIIKKFDNRGNLIYYKLLNNYGFECCSEYDKKGNEIHRKYGNGYKAWYKYDKNKNKIYSRNSSGTEYWWKYDEYNRLIYKKSFFDEEWYKYDDNNNLKYTMINENENWYKYDVFNNEVNITKQEFDNIKIKEYNSRTKCSRFEIMEI